MERDELRRGVPRPCLEIGAAGFVVRPDGRGTGTGGLGIVVGGKEAIFVCLSWQNFETIYYRMDT